MRLLLVGGGHAMLPLIVASAAHVRAGVDVRLVTDRPELWYSGMVPEWLGGVYSRGDVTVDLERLCARSGVRLVVSRAEAVDAAARTVRTADGQTLAFDVAAFDVGGANPGEAVAGRAFRSKPLHGVEALGAWLDVLAAGPERRARLAIVGGGAAGVEVALNLSARADVAGRLSLTLLEPGGRLVPALPARLGRWAEGALRARGASVRLNTSAARVGEAGVVLVSGETVAAEAVFWSTGSAGQALFAGSGLPLAERGWVRVEPSLRAVGVPRVFVGGDAAEVAGLEALPRIGVHAVRHGPVMRANVGRTLDALRHGRPLGRLRLEAFRPLPVAPLILSTGVPQAWWAAGPLALRGQAFLRLKHAIDRQWVERSREARLAAGSRWDARAAARAAARWG